MSTKLRRPPTVWLTQLLLIIPALLFSAVFVLTLTARVAGGEGFPIVGALITCSVVLGIVLVLLGSFWGLARRKNYGRWLSVGTLLFLWGFFILGQLFPPSGPYKYYEYKNTAQLAGAAIASVCFHGMFLVLILRLAFVRKVRDFFRPMPEPS